MKNSIKNQRKSINLQGLIFTFILLSISFSAISQEVRNFETVKPLSEKKSHSGTTDLYSLYYDNQPSLLIHKEKTVLTTKSPARVVEINVSNLDLLNNPKLNLKNIELIRVIYNQSDKTSILDLSKIESLSKLKAIVFQCDFNCTKKTIETLISFNTKINLPVYYLISIPE